MKIPFIDLHKSHGPIREEIDAVIGKIIDKSAFILGEESRLFEEEFACFCGVNYCVGVSSGTQALELALLAAGIKADDEVITAPNSFVATAEAILHVGALPIFADIGHDYNIDPDAIEKKITKKTVALLPVHLYGRPCRMDRITEIAKKNGLKIIGDCCQAHGAEYDGKNVGSYGTANCFSFYPSKNLGGFGDGGCLVTNDKCLADLARSLSNHGEGETRYEHPRRGFCYRLDNLQAAVLRVKLKSLSDKIEARGTVAKKYDELLGGTSCIVPPATPNGKNAYHLYVIRHPERDKLRQFLEERGITTIIHYPIPIHLEEGYRGLKLSAGSLPHAERYAKEILSLPFFPELTVEEIGYVTDNIKEFEKKHGPFHHHPLL